MDNKYLRRAVENWNFLLPVCYFVVSVIYILWRTPSEPIKDEVFFWGAAKTFSKLNFTTYFEHIKSYYPPQTPIIHTIAGLIYYEGISIKAFRFMDAVLSLGTLTLFFTLIDSYFKELPKWLLITCGSLFLLNPYFFLISSHYYTDTLYIFCVVFSLCVFFIKPESRFFWMACITPLVRQFGLFLAVGKIANSLIYDRGLKLVKNISFSVLSLVPLFLLFAYWGRTQPSPEWEVIAKRVSAENGRIIMSYPVYYLSALGFYMLPIHLYKLGEQLKNKVFYVGALVGIILYAIFPPVENFYLHLPLGFFHNFLITNMPSISHLIMGTFAALFSGRCAIYIVSTSVPTILKLWITIMFGIAAFSTICWDKFILDMMFVIVLGFLFWVRGKPSTSLEAR